jgi:PKD repeat protein
MEGRIGQEFTFTDKSVKGDEDIVKWFWNFGDGNYSSDSLNPIQRHTYSSDSGNILVTLHITDEFGCQDTANVSIVVTPQTSISMPDKESDPVKLYPNPTTGEINIEFADEKQRDIKVSDSRGRILHQKTYDEQKIQLFLGDFSAGTYYILIDNTTSVKFTIAK